MHFEHNGALLWVVLDVIELAKAHSGINLAVVFADTLRSFGIEDKVSK